jgi:hypothetical protein
VTGSAFFFLISSLPISAKKDQQVDKNSNQDKKKNMRAHILPPVPDSLASSQGWTEEEGPELSTPASRRLESIPQPPLGFPTYIESHMTWTRQNDVTFDEETIELSPEDVTEVEQALKHFLSMSKPHASVT